MVPCWIARPVEKTILVRGMLILAIFSIFLSICEIIFVTTKWGVTQRHLPVDSRSKFAQRLIRKNRDDGDAYMNMDKNNRNNLSRSNLSRSRSRNLMIDHDASPVKEIA